VPKIRFNTDDVTVYLAPAGGGKTFELIIEVIKALQIYRPDEVAFVTFTRNGVQKGIERILEALPRLSSSDLYYFKTFHSLFFNLLGYTPEAILTRKDIEAFNKALGFKLTLSKAFENQTEDDKLLNRYDAIRSGGSRGIVTEGAYDEERYMRLVTAYEAFKKKHGFVDFYDCLIQFKEKGEAVPVKCAFIDEAQDLTGLLWEDAAVGFGKAEKIVIAGDDYQTLFSYAGADPDILIDLANHYKTVKFERSFRLPKKVYTYSRQITKLLQHKVDKDFVPVSDKQGFVKSINDRFAIFHRIKKDYQKHGYIPGRWFLLFRNNCFIDDVATLMSQLALPYHTSKGFCIPDPILSRIRRYYNYRKTGYSTKESRNRFKRQYGIDSFSDPFSESELISSEDRYIYQEYVDTYGLDVLEEMAKNKDAPYVLLSTVHRVKGSEADFVAMFLDCTRRVSENLLLNLDEELRVFYVGCTRPKEGLYLVHSSGKYGLDDLADLTNERLVAGSRV